MTISRAHPRGAASARAAAGAKARAGARAGAGGLLATIPPRTTIRGVRRAATWARTRTTTSATPTTRESVAAGANGATRRATTRATALASVSVVDVGAAAVIAHATATLLRILMTKTAATTGGDVRGHAEEDAAPAQREIPAGAVAVQSRLPGVVVLVVYLALRIVDASRSAPTLARVIGALLIARRRHRLDRHRRIVFYRRCRQDRRSRVARRRHRHRLVHRVLPRRRPANGSRANFQALATTPPPTRVAASERQWRKQRPRRRSARPSSRLQRRQLSVWRRPRWEEATSPHPAFSRCSTTQPTPTRRRLLQIRVAFRTMFHSRNRSRMRRAARGGYTWATSLRMQWRLRSSQLSMARWRGSISRGTPDRP